MATQIALAFGAGVGATYLLDAQPGRRRRALIRDKLVHATHELAEGADVVARDVAHRGRGIVAEIRSRMESETGGDDDVIAERVRSKLGRVCSHPGAIEVRCREGQVTLKGDILKRDYREVISAVGRVRGVRGVDDQLGIHAHAGTISGLQGVNRSRMPRFELMQQNWSPAWRFVAATAGGALALYGLPSRNLVRVGAGAAGLLLLSRAVTNLDLRRLFGITPARRVIDVQKTIEIAAPIERVFELLSRPENFPRFMRHVLDVKKISEGRYRWRVEGPGGMPFEWEGVVTQLEPNRLIAWKTVDGTLVRNAGVVRFESEPSGLTRVHVRLSYNPPAGAIGHAVAKLFGADPKKDLDDDLLRFASLVVEGRATGRNGQVTAADLTGGQPPQRAQS
jgi:uncharacterized membrane protein